MSRYQSNQDRERRYLRYPGAALLLGVSESHLRKLVMARAVPHVKPFGARGRVLFDRLELERFIDEHRVPAAAS